MTFAVRNWTLDEIPSEAIANAQWRDNLLSLPHLYDYVATDATVTATTTETAIYSKAITGGDLGTQGMLELQLVGQITHNTTDTVAWKVTFGNTQQLLGSDNTVLPTSASVVPFEFRIYVANQGATNAQLIWGTYTIWNASIAGAGGPDIGNFTHHGSGVLGGIMANNGATIDTTTNQTLELRVTLGSASASNVVTRSFARLLLSKN